MSVPRFAIDVYGARAALGHAAAVFCSSEKQVVTDDPQKWSGRIDVEINVLAIH